VDESEMIIELRWGCTVDQKMATVHGTLFTIPPCNSNQKPVIPQASNAVAMAITIWKRLVYQQWIIQATIQLSQTKS
jgi:hypothetical protein